MISSKRLQDSVKVTEKRNCTSPCFTCVRRSGPSAVSRGGERWARSRNEHLVVLEHLPIEEDPADAVEGGQRGEDEEEVGDETGHRRRLHDPCSSGSSS